MPLKYLEEKLIDTNLALSYSNAFGDLKHGILMGNVLYNYPNNFFCDIDYKYRQLASDIIIKVPLGTFSLQPSREYIDNIKENRDAFGVLIKRVLEEIKEHFAAKFKNLRNLKLYDGVKEFYKIKKGYPYSLRNEDEWSVKKLQELHPRLASLIKRGFLNLHRNNVLVIENITTRQKQSNGIKVSSMLNLENKIIVKDRHEISIDKVFNACQCNIATFITPIRKDFIVNGRCDYSKLKNHLLQKIKVHLRCDDKDVTFVSDLFPIEEVKRGGRPKGVDYSKKILTIISLIHGTSTFDVKNPEKKYFYIRLTNRFDNYCLKYPNVHLHSELKQEIVHALCLITKNLNITDYDIIQVYKDQISEKQFANANYVDCLDFLKTHEKMLSVRKYDYFDELNKFFSNIYNYERKSILQPNTRTMSEFFTLAKNDKKDITDCIEYVTGSCTNQYRNLISCIDLKPTIEKQEESEWFKRYKEKYGKFISSILLKAKETSFYRQDEMIALWECWYLVHDEENLSEICDSEE